MPIFRLTDDPTVMPDPALAEPSGLLAVGGDLSPDRLLNAYATGVFPWFEQGQPILWWSPDPRLVLDPEHLHVSRSLRKTARSGRFEVRFDTAFSSVIRACAKKRRPGQKGTWITPSMIAGYERLFERGDAHCAEAWRDGQLVGGLYGVGVGGAFFGESMFADEPDASKVAFLGLLEFLFARGIDLVDCQVTTSHLQSFGAYELPRARFLERLGAACAKESSRGRWRAEESAQRSI